MNNLIKVTVEKDQQLVSARELHRALNIKTRFSLWVEQNFKMFIEHEDFEGVVITTPFNPKYPNGKQQQLQDYALTLDMAKHIAMMAGTDKGFEVRDYFIQVEKEWNSPEMIMKRALSYANSKVEKLETEVKQLQPDAEYCKNVLRNPILISSTEIAKRYGWGAVTLHKKLNELGVMYKQGKQWILYAKYSRLGYADRVRYEKGAGLLKWTPKGEKFIYDLLAGEGILPIIERVNQDIQLNVEEQIEYTGPYHTAGNIAWELHLPNVNARLVGKLANKYHLKPVFTDHNKYCRVVVDDDGFESYEYTQLGAETIEQLLELEGYI